MLEKLLYIFPEETAHHIAIWVLKQGLAPPVASFAHPALKTKVFGLDFANPVGLAAGFDKNAESLHGLQRQGFGFIETGTVTPKPQSGNPKPRLFRLTKDEAIINRMGFNGKGIEFYARNLEKNRRRNSKTVIGANIGKNKDTLDPIADYVLLIEQLYGLSDYIAINISSPNTQGLRGLQAAEPLKNLLAAVTETAESQSSKIGKSIPLLLKIAPDLSEAEQEDIARIVLQYPVSGLIIGNTTIGQRENLQSDKKAEAGGLSGRPLFQLSNKVLKNIYILTNGKIPLIGCGGISSGHDAYTKILNGASLIQVYSSLIYKGFSLVAEINKVLVNLLEKDGFSNISEAVGAKAR